MTAATIIALIQTALAAAKSEEVAEIAASIKALINSLAGKVITAQEQNALNAFVDSVCELAAAGLVPDHWSVEPDPE